MSELGLKEIRVVSTRPSRVGPKRRTTREKPLRTGVELASERYALGQDIWTGLALQGEDARQWLRIFFQVEEEHGWATSVESIIEVRGDHVTVALQDGRKKIVVRHVSSRLAEDGEKQS